MDLIDLQRALETLGDGMLYGGKHEPGHKMCVLEFDSLVRGRAWSDAPTTLPDLRALDDGPWTSGRARTAALLPVMAALWHWAEWSRDRQRHWATRVVIATVRVIVAELPGLPESVRVACRAADTVHAAEAAALAARAGAAEAAEAAAGEAAAQVLIQACRIWIEAASFEIAD